jgi:NAD(P)-dependent dehydrogenase (short-subunit alcohol dehydrogenase family)
MQDLHGKVALVTGGASGIGRATSERLAEEGARVVVADRDATLGPRVADAIGGRFVDVDVSDAGAWTSLVADVVGTEGGLDVVYLNAGVTTGESDIRKLTDEQYRRIAGLNIDQIVFGARACAAQMAETGGGAIVATASIAGLIGFSPDPVYTMTKHAVVGLVRGLAPALEPLGVSINAICPGIVDTPLVGEQAKQGLEAAGFPLMPASQIADAVITAIRSGETGVCWVCQPGRDAERFQFGQVPGPRREGAAGIVPPDFARGRG